MATAETFLRLETTVEPPGDKELARLLEGHPLSRTRRPRILPDGVALVDEQGVIRHVSEQFASLAGYAPDELNGQIVESLLPSRFRQEHVGQHAGFFAAPGLRSMGRDPDSTLLRRDGSELAVEVALAPLVLDDQPWVIVLIRDDSPERFPAEVHPKVEQPFRIAFESSMAPMVLADLEDRAIAVNDAFCEMLGRTRDELLGHDATHFTHPEDLGIGAKAHHGMLAGSTDQARYVKRYVQKGGRVIDVEVSKSPARDEAGTALYFAISERDITAEKALTAQLSRRALDDPLTGLANRALFEDRLVRAHARVKRHGGLGVVLMVGLDDFKGVNDLLGHLAGDQLLVAVARRFELVTRSSDTLCRFGGDEFLYLAEGLTSADEADQMAARLLDVLSEPFDNAGSPINQHASVGVVLWDGTSTDCAELVQNADAAMYEAKRVNRGRYVVFTPSMRQQAASHFALTQELHHALLAGELSMHYQPIVDLTTAEVVGFEALMRWRHPERGWIPPDVFIPLAEQSTLITELGVFALREAVAAASTWPRIGDQTSRPYVTVNLSARQFHDPNLVSNIEQALLESNLKPERLILEITESVALHDIAETLSAIERLSRRGVQIALDDFGTGYSSLSYLTLLRPKIIKIDRLFVSSALDYTRNDTLLQTIISLGKKLNMIVLAEGIESLMQYRHLRNLGCELGQGFLFSPAVPTGEVTASVGRVSSNLGHPEAALIP